MELQRITILIFYFGEEHQAGYDLLQFTEMVWWVGKDYQSQSFGFPIKLCYVI